MVAAPRLTEFKCLGNVLKHMVILGDGAVQRERKVGRNTIDGAFATLGLGNNGTFIH